MKRFLFLLLILLPLQAYAGPDHTEDDLAVSGQVGTACLAVRNDSAAALTSTDGDYSNIAVDSAGRLLVGAGTAASSLGKAEDSAHTTADVGVLALGVFRSSATQSAGTTADYSAINTDADGRLYVNSYGAGPGEFWQGCGTATATTANVAIKAAVASNRNYVTSITCSSSSATTATNINFKDGSTTIAVGGTSQMATTSAGTFTATFPVPLRGSVNTAFNFNTAVSVTSVVCCATGFISTN